MAELVVMRTRGTEKEILSGDENIIQIFLISRFNAPAERECGDFLINSDFPNKFALIVKETTNGKTISEALRVSVLTLIKHLLEEGRSISTILINRFQFTGKADEYAFINTLREFLMTYFGEILKDPVNLIICDYKD